MWARSCSSVTTAALGQRKLTSVGEDAVSPSSCLNPSPHPPQVLSFVSFVCFTASTAAAFVTVPLLEFLGAVFLLFAYSTKFNERFKGFLWPLMVRRVLCWETLQRWTSAQLNFIHVLSQDFMRCMTASIIYFIVSIMAVSRYVDGSSKAAGVNSSSWFPSRPLHFSDAGPPCFRRYLVSSPPSRSL